MSRQANNAIVPGSFVQVQLHVAPPRISRCPADALVLRGNKDFVAVVTPNNTVALS